MESVKRIAEVLWAPTQTFRKMVERPTWVVALIVLLGLGAAVGLVAVQKIDTDAQRDMLRERFEEGGLRGDELEGRVDQAMEWSRRFAPVAPLFGVAAGALGYLAMALLFLVAFRLAGGEVSYAQSVSVTLHGFMPHGLAALLSVPVVLSRQSLDPETLQRGGSLLASSLASVAPEGTSPPVLALLGSLDLFTVWTVVLLVLGYRTVARVSMGTAATVVGAAWLLWIGFRVGMAVLFS